MAPTTSSPPLRSADVLRPGCSQPTVGRAHRPARTAVLGLVASVVVASIALIVPSASAQDAPSLVVGRDGAPSPEDLDGLGGSTPVGAAAGAEGELWVVDADGVVATAGGAAHHGDLEGVAVNRPVVGMAATPTGDGYWLVAADGGVFSYGDADFHGSTGGLTLNRPAVGMAATPTGDGYWLVAADGGVFSYGDADFHGSTGGLTLNRPAVGMAATPTGDGYWLVAADGGVFSYGDAEFTGSTGSEPPADGVVAMAPGPDGGYVLATSSGRLVGFGPTVTDGPSPTGTTIAVVAAPGGGWWMIGSGAITLPFGGTEIFADGRRLVAHYGSPISPRLGILGTLPPDQAVQAVIDRAAQYGTVGVDVIPAVEIITTIATSAPGADGDYSGAVDDAELAALVDAATARGVYVVLDLQPGQSDFLTQARAYEQYLVRPNVGLALDPEWRMGPGQVPAEVIGSVGAAEVNATSAYLAELVAANGLPEKLMVIHQFTPDMVRDRDAIVDRDGVAVLYHADGFGGAEAKLGDLRRFAGEAPFRTGFKIFLDEDSYLFSPAEVLSLDPRVDLVTYQ